VLDSLVELRSDARRLRVQRDNPPSSGIERYNFHLVDVRFGSKAAATGLIFGVRFTPNSGHEG